MRINDSFVLPEWGDDLKNWEELANKATSMLLKVYHNSPSFTKYYKIFRERPSKDEVNSIISSDSNSILPLAFLSQSDPTFYFNYFDDKIINLILQAKDEISPRCGRLLHNSVLSNLSDDFSTLSPRVLRELFIGVGSSVGVDIDKMERLGLFSGRPLSEFANYCVTDQRDPEDLLNQCGIQLQVNSSFLRFVKIKVLLTKLEQLDFRQDSELCATIYQKNIYNLDYTESELVGHQIIRIILSSDLSVEIHKSWTQLILSIASDPRTSRNSIKYRKWWSKIDQNLIDRFIKILSHSEILLFLDSIANFASEANSEMSRMFESRRQLLVGLSIQNKIEKSRLFLPKNVIRFLRKENPKLDLSYVCVLNGSQDKCVIYLKIGDFHVIEGSHNCKIRLYPEFYSENEILNHRLKEIEYGRITTGIEYDHSFGQGAQTYAFVHHVNGGWKRSIINILGREMDFEIDKLLTDQEINYFRY